MSKRGRRRSSRRRKSSSSSKQSVSPYIFQKQNQSSSSVDCRDDVVEKGETDSLRRENISGSEDEEKDNVSPPKDKRFKRDSSANQSISTQTTEDKETVVKMVTSVSVSDSEDSSPNITIQQIHHSPEKQSQSSTPVTNIMKINCAGSKVKLEIQLSNAGMETTFVLVNEKGDDAGTPLTGRCDGTQTPNGESPEPPSQNHTTQARRVSPGQTQDDVGCQCCCAGHRQQTRTDCGSGEPPAGSRLLLNHQPLEKRKPFHRSFSIDQFWNVPPPQEFADLHIDRLEEMRRDLTSCRTERCPPDNQPEEFHTRPDFFHQDGSAEERADQLSEPDHSEATFTRPSFSTNRSSFTKDFISSQKRTSWIRNNSIATVERRACPLPQKRRQTFPGMWEGLGLMQEDLLLPCNESFSSLIICSPPLQSETLGTNDKFPASGGGHGDSCSSEIPNSHSKKFISLSPFRTTGSEDNPDVVFTVDQQSLSLSDIRSHRQGLTPRDFDQSISRDVDSLDTDDWGCKGDQSEVVDSGFDQEMGEYQSPEELSPTGLAIHVIPPSCSGSEEQMQQSHPLMLLHNISASPKHQASIMTLADGELEQSFLQMNLSSTCSGTVDDPCRTPLHVSPSHTGEVTETAPQTTAEETSLPLTMEETKDLQLTAGHRGTEDRGQTELHRTEHLRKTDPQIPSSCSFEVKEHLKPVMHKEVEGGGGGSGCDHWATRRKLFRESKQWSSAGEASVTSDITEESVSEDTRSMDMTVGDNEDGGFYMETFHSSAWIYQGDDVGSGDVPPGLSSRARAVSVRERTVKINKGTGEYPWGFRIQFSKPIVVTEVDTNGAAEEAGLMVGDYVLSVNGTDVTSIPHSQAADLARQGPDVLTLTIGSDIARGPNTPRPACRGYLHKRTQSGLIKGWRKRWFVLTHDCCLYYHRHKRDEGRRRPLSAVKLEGAEVGLDVSLGKPFVFKCRPQSVNRVFFFCATSNQEMKRWLEAMETAVHPVARNHVWVDVTRHNSNLPPLAVKNPECLGLLHKMDKSKDTWVQHYCILKDACLYLYSGIRATHAHGGMYLQGYTVREQPYGSKRSTIELKPPSDEFKSFYLCAENPNENKRWITAIKASIKKWLPLHQALQDYMNRPPEETRM